MPFFTALGKRICELRRQIGMTQAELALELDISQPSIFAYELGDRRVPTDLLPKLAAIFQVSIDELLKFESSLPPPRKRRISARISAYVKLVTSLPRHDQHFLRRLAEALAERAKTP